MTQLRTYDRNPRRSQNSEYERIKAFIRAEGLDQPLVVTCRPGENNYMPLAGGNTRLRAMLSLYEETGDEAFRYLDCLFKPWVAESDILLSHLRENELRDDLRFIDKARAAFEVEALIEMEMQGRPLAQRRLSEMMAVRGLSFSQTLISRMAYAVQTLWPLIPQALSAGMGSPRLYEYSLRSVQHVLFGWPDQLAPRRSLTRSLQPFVVVTTARTGNRSITPRTVTNQ